MARSATFHKHFVAEKTITENSSLVSLRGRTATVSSLSVAASSTVRLSRVWQGLWRCGCSQIRHGIYLRSLRSNQTIRSRRTLSGRSERKPVATLASLYIARKIRNVRICHTKDNGDADSDQDALLYHNFLSVRQRGKSSLQAVRQLCRC